MRNNYGSSLAVVGIDEDVVRISLCDPFSPSFATNFLREYLNDTVIIACTNNIMVCWVFFLKNYSSFIVAIGRCRICMEVEMLFIHILRDDCNSVHVRITFLFLYSHKI